MLAQKQPSTEAFGPIDAVLDYYHNGDVRATIATLLADCGHLREQLSLATGLHQQRPDTRVDTGAE